MSAMPKLIAASGSVFQAEPGAHHYRFVGLEIAPADGVALNTLVQLGDMYLKDPVRFKRLTSVFVENEREYNDNLQAMRRRLTQQTRTRRPG